MAQGGFLKVKVPVVVLALFTGLIAVPGAARAQFPGFTPTLGVTPEGVAVDKTGNVYVSVRTGTDGLHGAIWKFTRDGEWSLFCHSVGVGLIGGGAKPERRALRRSGDRSGTRRISRGPGRSGETLGHGPNRLRQRAGV